MQRSAYATQARRELDRRFSAADLSPIRSFPSKGWIRAIRVALGMTQADLGNRLSISRVAVDKLERAEPLGGITTNKLAEVAAAMDCTLVYALIPNSSLDETVMSRARSMAKSNMDYVSQTMALEAQDVGNEWKVEALEREAEQLVAKGHVWK
jgi:predicted DNA-binding mobile mystery protein A